MHKAEEISYEKIFEYIDNFNAKDTLKLNELRDLAVSKKIPVIKDDVRNFLEFALHLKKPKNILEIGTAVGYSAIVMAQKSYAQIDTVEIDENMRDTANKNIENFGLKERIKVHLGDAREVIPKLEKKYDFVFIDASKSHYDEFYALSTEKLAEKALIVFDNILQKGYVCLPKQEVKRSGHTIYNKMTAFLEKIRLTEKSYDLLPLGDGLLLINR